MKKLVSLVVLGAMILAACGGGSGTVAATVDGTEVTVGDVEALIDSEESTIPVDQFSQYLAFAIQWNILFNAAARDFGVSVPDEEVEEEATRLYEQLSGEESREEFLSSRGITEEFLSKIAEQGLIDVAIREQLIEEIPQPPPEEIDLQREIAIEALTEACVSHILVDTEEEANDILTRLEQGEEFGELATELSNDPGSAQNNGILPCGSPEGYVEPFKRAIFDATVGELYPTPVQTQFGYHIILVTDRVEPSGDDVPSDVELAEIIRQDAVLIDLQAWFNGIMEEADVTVNEDFGTWQPLPPAVNPPTGE
jgi:parvulin-like peptidyl-prolyl isomerase